MDAGESVSKCCIREVWEETGLEVEIVRLVGVYSTPHRITRYADGNQFQFVSFSFEAAIAGGAMGLSDETTEIGFFSKEEIAKIDLMESHVERIEDVLALTGVPFIK